MRQETVPSQPKYSNGVLIPAAGAAKVRSPYFQSHWKYKDGTVERPLILYRGQAPYPYAIKLVGDCWQEIDSNGFFREAWFWNGIYWVSDRQKVFIQNALLERDQDLILQVDLDCQLHYVENIVIDYLISGANGGNKYWIFNLFRVSQSYGWTWLGTVDSLSNWTGTLSINLNQYDNLSLSQVRFYYLRCDRQGNAGDLNLGATLNYRKCLS